MKNIARAFAVYCSILTICMGFVVYELILAIKAVDRLTVLSVSVAETQRDKNAHSRADWATKCINDNLSLPRNKEEGIGNRSDCIDSAFRLYPAPEKGSK